MFKLFTRVSICVIFTYAFDVLFEMSLSQYSRPHMLHQHNINMYVNIYRVSYT